MFRAIKDIKKILIFTTLIMMTSGVLWLIFDNFVVIETELGPDHHPLQKWFLTAHGLMSAVFIFIFGITYAIHVQRNLKQEAKKKSGWTNLIFWSLMIISGYSLLYLANEDVREGLAVFHWILGLSSIAIFFIHSRNK